MPPIKEWDDTKWLSKLQQTEFYDSQKLLIYFKSIWIGSVFQVSKFYMKLRYRKGGSQLSISSSPQVGKFAFLLENISIEV